ncbi:Helix-turn-helix [Agreia bicolorata]|uniref:Helix-turn-helix n=1 Tax=Agreia bicolorata TaxID=110935 RepID=A0A1T4WVP6_9MICO|nr:helix-turn-helix transcriptional regulator [Agreia bicolorata]SKA81197.1 Helix-turn-helix [Agreia bicolorata]
MTKTHSDAATILGERVREQRLKLGLTLEDLASLSEMHWTSVGKIERGQVHPNVETLVRLATALNADPGVFVEGLTASMYEKRVHGLTAADFIREREREASRRSEAS